MAHLINLTATQIAPPPIGAGVIYWGPTTPTWFAALAISHSATAPWLAKWDSALQVAVIFWPASRSGELITADITAILPKCPNCGPVEASPRGANWLCGCGKLWRIAPMKARGGAGRGQGRKVKSTKEKS
jgi:hypothetical protein